jgi:hypothetical protein
VIDWMSGEPLDWLAGPSRLVSRERTHEVVALAARPQAVQFDVICFDRDDRRRLRGDV